VPNGIPGVAARLPILFSEGVKKGRISLSDFVALTATNHAKMYGLYPRKGSIMVGADADIAIWDPHKTVTLSQDLMQHGSDYTPYEGMEVTGWPIKTLLRGTLIADDGQIVGEPGMGQFQARQTTQSAGSA
jgi:dihydropyrimidinase